MGAKRSWTAIRVFLCAYFYNRRQQVRLGDEMSDEVHPVDGGPQGSVLVMFCWLLYIDDLPGVVKNCGVSLFMDHVALWV